MVNSVEELLISSKDLIDVIRVGLNWDRGRVLVISLFHRLQYRME